MKTLTLHLTILSSFLMCLPLTANAYYNLSPYCYCGNNPVNCIDPNGEDIVVLNYTEGQHLAMLIQDENGKWQYYSVNGDNMVNPLTNNHSGGRPFNDVAVGSWDSPEEFLNSSYNVRNEGSKENPDMNHFGFSEGFQISTSPEQDEIMRNSFMEKSTTRYTPLGNNCATTVQSVLFQAGIPVAKPTYVKIHVPANKFLGEPEYNIVRPNINPWPRSAFKSIMQLNPQGTYIHKR